MQQKHCYNQNDLFTEYLYQSNTSKTLTKFFAWLSKEILNPLIKNKSRILEIASNDGSFIKSFKKINTNSVFVGIDPAINITNIALNDGISTIADFFPSKKLMGKFDLIIAQNVLAHTPDPLNMVTAMAEHLDVNGIIYIQVSQANMINNVEFDTLYHEHYSFFSDSSIAVLSESCKLELRHVIVSRIHGGSKGYFLVHPSNNIEFNFNNMDSEFFITSYKYEYCYIDLLEKFHFFQNNITEKINEIKVVHDSFSNSKRVLVGIAAKSITVMQSAGLNYDFYLDEAPLKISKYIPGTVNPILHINEIKNIDDNAVYFIGAWNFYEEIRGKLINIKGKNVHTISYFPKLIQDY